MNARFHTPDAQARAALKRIESAGRAVYLDRRGQIHVVPRAGLDSETIALLTGARAAAVAILAARQQHKGLSYLEWRRRLPAAAFTDPEIAAAYGAYHLDNAEFDHRPEASGPRGASRYQDRER